MGVGEERNPEGIASKLLCLRPDGTLELCERGEGDISHLPSLATFTFFLFSLKASL
jgi:hypothetical protein